MSARSRGTISCRIGLPRGRVPRPQQAVVADDAVVTVGQIGIRHRAAIGDRLGEARPERRGGDRIAPDRHQRADNARHQRGEMDVAGEDDMAGTHAGGRRGDALAHAFGIDRERWLCARRCARLPLPPRSASPSA